MVADSAQLGQKARSLFRLAVVTCAILVSVIPATLVRIPPILDYPNHYVRLWLITGGARLPPVARMYAVDWTYASTNIAIDLVAWALKGIAPVSVIGPIVLMLAIILRPLGIILLGQTLYKSARWWHVLCFVLAWNWVLIAGYLNFEISLGLAMLGAAVDVRWTKYGHAVLVPLRIAISGVVLVAHPFGLIFYAALLVGLAFGESFAPLLSACNLRRAILRIFISCLPTLVPVVALVMLAPVLPGGHDKGHPFVTTWQEPTVSAHVSMLLIGLKTYNVSIDAIFGTILALPVLIALIHNRLRIHAGLLVVTIVLTVAALLMPSMIFGIAGVDTRLPGMIALSFSVAVLPDFRFSRRVAACAIATAMLVVAARSAWIGRIWLERQADFASLSRALQQVPQGAAILPLEHMPSAQDLTRAPVGRFLGNNPLFWHYPTLAIMDRRDFEPTLFAAAGQQPIRVLPPWNALAVAAGPIAPIDKVGDPNQRVAPYLNRWSDCFDYILVVNADMPNAGGPLLASPIIVLMKNEGFAELYRVIRSADHTCF